MSIRAFFAGDCPAIAKQTVESIEAKTSCEIVFSMLPMSSRYMAIDLIFASMLAFIALCLLLFLPHDFHLLSFVFEILFFFVLGFFISNKIHVLKRLFLFERISLSEVQKRAKTLFYDLGISRTKDRNGFLILFSIFEQKVVIIADIGVCQKENLDFILDLEKKMSQSLKSGNRETFFDEAKSLGLHLSHNFPLQDDDINELPDEMVRL